MGKAWESTSPEAIEFVLEEHHFFGLLLDDFSQLALLRDLCALLLGIGSVLGFVLRTQPDDGLAIIYLLLQRACFGLKLLVFGLLFPNLALEFLLGLLDSFDPVKGVLFELLDLLLKTLFVFFVSLDVLSLDDLLGLLGHAVKLDILGSFLEVQNLQLQPLLPRFDALQSLIRGHDLVHQTDLQIANSENFAVFVLNYTLLDQSGIFVIRCYRLLRNLNLALSHVNNDLVVELEFRFVLNPLELFLMRDFLSLVQLVLNLFEEIFVLF